VAAFQRRHGRADQLVRQPDALCAPASYHRKDGIRLLRRWPASGVLTTAATLVFVRPS
jgi:hypothetical protein